ncbi:hypothetical protein ACGC1H_004933 [Rhizoctonia solani]|uniref:Uncharacterized protein n=1 Tax=Rhizoctonia solani TaxID=456999 RepID=A0A8H3BVU9_9AGAM|nr:unnamed protein product [Rhizoctonia solani]
MMQGGPSIISSRMFARDDRPVPNIVAIYERPRLKVRRDATHVLGGMFGWNAPEEMARALRSEDLPAEDSTASIPNSASADPSLSGPQQRCVKRPIKRSKRRSIIPLAEMGASILSLSLQERMNRRQEGEKEDYEPVSALVKPPTSPLDVTSAAPNSTLTVKKIKVAAPGDAPTAKKLRLTISTAPPASTTSLSTPLLQLPLSPPDTSSNASKAPADDRFAGLVASSTPRTDPLPMPNFDLDLSNLGGLSLSTLDSDSDSDSSSSESSSESSSDSPDLSSSTSTRSAPQDKTKGKEKNAAGPTPNNHQSRNSTPSFASSIRDPSTPPPRRKRRTHPPGWVGWVQTEESPDHSRLIRLDDVPVILGRRTRSGKEFVDPPPIRRKSTTGDEVKEKRSTKSVSNSSRTGQKSGRQNPLPEAQKRGVTEESVESKVDEEHIPVTAEPSHSRWPSKRGAREPSAPVPVNPGPEKAVAMLSADTGDTTSAPKRIRTSLGESTNAHQPVRGTIPSVAKVANALPTPKPSSVHIPVLKLTRSDAIITPTGGRSKEPERKEASPVKDSSSKIPEPDKVKSLGDLPMRPLPTSDSTRKDVVPANPEKPARLSIRGTAQSQPKGTSGTVSRPALGTSNSSILINNAKLTPTGSNPSPDSNVKRTIPVTSSSSKNAPISAVTEKTRTAARNSVEKVQPTKADPTWSHGIQQTSNSDSLDKLTPNANSSTSVKASSFMSRTARPFPMALPSRTEKSEPEPKPTPFVKLSTLGKRKDSSSPLPSGQSSSSSQSRVKKRKLALSSSDESEGPRFIVNPFDRRAKKLELTRKGVSGDTFQAEMKKWMHAKKAEWKERERQKEKQNDRPSGNEVRTAIAEGKPVSEFVRHRLAGASTSTRIGEAKLARKKVYNSDWGMDVAKVSVAGSSEKRTQPRLELETEKRDANAKDARESSKVKRESDTSRDLVKPRRVAI